jgi:hypothetical protein
MPRKGIVNKAVVPRVRNTKKGKKGSTYTRYFPTASEMAYYKNKLKSIKRRKLGL